MKQLEKVDKKCKNTKRFHQNGCQSKMAAKICNKKYLLLFIYLFFFAQGGEGGGGGI